MRPPTGCLLYTSGGTKHDFKLDFATEKEAEQFASDMDWCYVDENQFEWRLAVEEDATAEKQAIKNRHTEEVEVDNKDIESRLKTGYITDNIFYIFLFVVSRYDDNSSIHLIVALMA